MRPEPVRAGRWPMVGVKAIPAAAAHGSRLTLKRAVLLVAATAGLLRLWGLASLPLVITNDGVGYLHWAEQAARGEPMELPPLRTPGYPWLLAGTFTVLGTGPVAVLVLQRLLGAASAVIAALAANRLSGPATGMVVGLLVGLDPWIFTLESYALSEVPTVFAIMAAVGIVVCRPGAHLGWSALLGALLGAACLLRPACQSFAPFIVLAWVAAPRVRKSWRALALVSVLAGWAMLVVPWLAHNMRRGMYGLANGAATHQWMALSRAALLDPQDTENAQLRSAYERLGNGRSDWNSLCTFVLTHDGYGHNAATLGDWARRSARRRPAAYLRAAGYALANSLNYYPRGGSTGHDDITFFMERLGAGGDNDQFEGDFETLPYLAKYKMAPEGGPLRAVLRWCAGHRVEGLPQVPIFGCAVGVCLIAGVQRRWPLALVSAGSVVFVLIHALLLVPFCRYPVVVWPVWYVLAGYVVSVAGRALRLAAALAGPHPGTRHAGQDMHQAE